MTPTSRASTFFSYYLAAPVVLSLYASYKLWFRTRIVRVHEMDLVTGCRIFDIDQLAEREAAEQDKRSSLWKIYKLFC